MGFLGLRNIVVKKYNHVGPFKIDNTKDYPNFLEHIKSKNCDISKLNITKNDTISIVKQIGAVELKINEELRGKYEGYLNGKPKKISIE